MSTTSSTSAPSAATRRAPRVLIAGGGSGGHVFPGLAVADALRSRGIDVAWVGGGGMEGDLVRSRGLDFHQLAARPLVGRGVVGKARAVLTLADSAWRARSLVRRAGARAVLGTGGYASAPGVVGGRLAGRPVLLLEPNADAGVANRVLSRLATEALTAHDDTAASLHCPATRTGVPIRAAFDSVGSPPEPPPLRVLVLGGSQGARQINRLLPAAFSRLRERADDAEPRAPIEVTHQTGRAHVEATRAAYAAAGLSGPASLSGPAKPGRTTVEVVDFIDDVAAAMERSHLVVSRAGAITLAEICAAGRPALLLPLRLAAGHQEANARRLEAAGAARVLGDEAGDDGQAEEKAATALGALLGALPGDAALRERMGAAARGLAHPHAAERIAERIAHHVAHHVDGSTARGVA